MNELKAFDYDSEVFIPARKGRAGRILDKSRYIKPPACKEIPERYLKYSLAEDLAKEIPPGKGMRVFVLIDGTFIAGDFIEAFMVQHNLHAKRISISTLSLSQNNVDSLKNLIDGDFVDEVNLIVSDYFFSHERRGLVEYMQEVLDIDDKFQLAAAGSHCKITLIETHCGMKIVIHGSANLRSSSNIEHLCIEESPELFDFNQQVMDSIIETYKIINKPIRYKTLWQQVQG